MGFMATPNQVRERVNEYGARPEPLEFPHNKRGPIIAELNEICESDENRYIVFGWLFSPDDEPMKLLRSKDLTPQQWYGLQRWQGVRNISFHEQDADEWVSRQEFPFEVRCLLTRAAYHWEVTQVRGIPIGALVLLPTEGEPMPELAQVMTTVDYKPYEEQPRAVQTPLLPSPETELEF